VGTLLVQFFVLNPSNTKELILEITINTCAVIFSIVWVAIGWIGVRKESNNSIKLFLFLSILEPAFIIYTLVTNTKVYEFMTIYVVVTLGGMALLCRIILIAWTFVVWNGFKKGLRIKVFGASGDEEKDKEPLINN